MGQTLFSLVIPTFNYGRFLGRAIDSALAQSGGDHELIVVDDGSTDDTPRVAASHGSRIRYFRQARQGVFLACKRGFDAAQGRFLIFFDADDALAPDALAHLRREIARRPDAGLVAGRHANVTASGQRLSPGLTFGKSRAANFRNFLLGRQFICTGAAAIRREAADLLRRCYQGDLRVGMETACIAHTLWFYDSVAVDHVLLSVHDHPGRLRDNLAEIQRAGEELVDAVFHPEILPPEAAKYRELFRARLLRDRSRSFHKAGLHAEAVACFHDALRSDPMRSLRDGRNLRRYLVSQVRRRVAESSSFKIEGRPSRETGVVEVSGRAREHRRCLNASAHEFLRRCSALGDVVKLNLARPTYLLSNPRDTLHVFVEQPGRYRRTALQAAFRQLFGRGLFSRTGRSHIDHRRLIQPLLHRARLDGFLPPLRTTLAEFVPHWNDGQTLEANSTLADITLRAAGRMILGLERAEDAAELFTAIHGSHQRVVRNMQSSIPWAARLPTKRNRTLSSHIARLDAVMRRLIDDARGRDRSESLLSQLVHLRDSAGTGLDDGQIRDHAATIFLAAYEPPATGLMWTLDLLARRPDAQRTLQTEIDAHARESETSGRADDAASLLQRPYMAQVISEALRLYPSTWLLTRRAAERDALPSGASVPPGADVFASPLLIHRNARHYDQPDEFRPERFASGPAERRAAGTYFPFGLGPTVCLGEYLARLMMAVTLEAILGRFTLEDSSDDAPQIHSANLFTMQPDRPIRLLLSARSTASSQRGVLSAAPSFATSFPRRSA
jgi:cytochrome P450